MILTWMAASPLKPQCKGSYILVCLSSWELFWVHISPFTGSGHSKMFSRSGVRSWRLSKLWAVSGRTGDRILVHGLFVCTLCALGLVNPLWLLLATSALSTGFALHKNIASLHWMCAHHESHFYDCVWVELCCNCCRALFSVLCALDRAPTSDETADHSAS